MAALSPTLPYPPLSYQCRVSFTGRGRNLTPGGAGRGSMSGAPPFCRGSHGEEEEEEEEEVGFTYRTLGRASRSARWRLTNTCHRRDSCYTGEYRLRGRTGDEDRPACSCCTLRLVTDGATTHHRHITQISDPSSSTTLAFLLHLIFHYLLPSPLLFYPVMLLCCWRRRGSWA